VQVAYSFIKEGEFEKSVGDFILDWFDNKSYIEMNTWNYREHQN
jgi:O-succinylbenzoic acid--CoA ligase